MTFLREYMLIKQMNQESDIFHYWYFLDQVFRFQTCSQCCHDFLIMSIMFVILLF